MDRSIEYVLKQWIALKAVILIGYSDSEYPLLFTSEQLVWDLHPKIL